MFSTATTAGYADVFLYPESMLTLFFVILVGIGFLAFIWGVFVIDFTFPLVVGAALMVAGIIGIMGSPVSAMNTKTEIEKNMISNVEEKYGADLKVSETPDVNTLGIPMKYILVFENGASAKYTMYFEKSGEPVIVDESKAPTVQELNEGKEAKTPVKESAIPESTKSAVPVESAEPKTAPTPAELQESAKK